MNTSEINTVLTTDRRAMHMYAGTFSWDRVPNLIDNTFAVVNTDDSAKAGKHWVLFAHTRGKLQFFDSYGRPPAAYPGIPSVVDSFNKKKLQGPDSATCGQWVVFVALNIARGRELDEIIAPFGNDLHSNDHYVNTFIRENYGLNYEVHDIASFL